MSVSTAAPAPSRPVGLPLVSRLARLPHGRVSDDSDPDLLLVLVFTAAFAEFIAPHNPEVGSLLPAVSSRRPGLAGGKRPALAWHRPHRRDVLSRLIFGARCR